MAFRSVTCPLCGEVFNTSSLDPDELCSEECEKALREFNDGEDE